FIVTTMAIFNKVVGDSHFLWLPERKDCLNDFLKHDLPWQTIPYMEKEFVERLGGFDYYLISCKMLNCTPGHCL
ncbi:MAG: hypothetical protein IPP64_05315, partial [Bacteroidetes bacterium]|nr:hypothetical protein [Bacteroidota bacterium]